MNLKKVHILQPVGSDYLRLFRWLGYQFVGLNDKPDLLCFTGGSDVSPYFYKHKRHPSTYAHPERDINEKLVYDRNVGKVPMVGICRGGQFLNVMNGGTMYQDVSDHGVAKGHILTDKVSGLKIVVSSTHHQMMKPGPDHTLIATANEGGTRTFWDEGKDAFSTEKSTEDIEVVLYKKTRSLCFQPHPEYESEELMPMRHYFRDLVNEHLS